MDDNRAKTAEAIIVPEHISLRTQLVSQGFTKDLLASSDITRLHITCYAPRGGENGLHAHFYEDHVFVVLQGVAQFYGVKGPLPLARKNEAIWLPRGSQYSFENPGDEPMILLRFGANYPGDRPNSRIGPDGKEKPGRDTMEGAVPVALVDGKFFE